ncbi:hypothetical protein [Halobacillus sp. A5]|uniref:hypothetical protein n=1 Tax=Halobacillus sp. A5 TaxID=2880263 RepID=UPI0020A6B99B|nr:hypothetical protein [Halobacillus sp. A5]MCP3027137.1 hypothetical protein [Halobacillus sp. A5]
MVGEKDKVGFISGSAELLVETNKYMWHVWGEDMEGKSFKVTGKNLGNGDEKTLVDSELEGPNNKADAHTPSNMTFPSEGDWELEVFADGEQLQTLVIQASHE